MHPKLGASWEEILRFHQPDEAYLYAVHSSCELDLLMFLRGRKVGVEFKRADAPKLTRSMQTVLADLALDELWVVYPGTRSYALNENIRVLPLAESIGTAGDAEGQNSPHFKLQQTWKLFPKPPRSASPNSASASASAGA